MPRNKIILELVNIIFNLYSRNLPTAKEILLQPVK